MDAIKYSKLIDVGHFYGGLSGKSKDDFEDGNAKFITYMNVFSNPSLNINVDDTVRIEEDEKQNVVKFGDVIFTGSSETPNECGMSSVLEEHIDEPLYLNSFCFGYRFNDLQAIVPAFYKHLFRSYSIRAKIAKTANGVTRFNVSKKLFGEIEIPLPPLSIQQEIVRVLDYFTAMITNLETELASRQKQYEHYRNQLLTFDENAKGVEIKTLREVCEIRNGYTPSKSNPMFWEDGVLPWFRLDDIRQNGRVLYDAIQHITQEAVKRGIPFKANSVIVSTTATIGEHALIEVPFVCNQQITVLTPTGNLLPKYLYYLGYGIGQWCKNNVNGAGLAIIPTSRVGDCSIYIPSLQRQKEIVEILDTFEALISNIKQELEARKKQYEYYREKLLTFE